MQKSKTRQQTVTDMSPQKIISEAETILKKSGIDYARLEAELLLCHALKINREKIVAGDISKLSAKEQRRFFALIKRRARREPLAYITGHKEFYGLDFLVNQHTLIPRPETELLVETALEQLRITNRGLRITLLDIGTGSGIIAITLAKQFPHAKIFATDISVAALRIARKNAQHHQAKIIFKKGNLLSPLRSQLSNTECQLFITANLPYLSTKTWRATQPEIKKFEPSLALKSGPDGLRHYRQLLTQLKKLLHGQTSNVNCHLFLEIDHRQTKPLTVFTKKLFPHAHIEIKKDLTKRDRVFILSFIPLSLNQTQQDDLSPAPTSHQHSA